MAKYVLGLGLNLSGQPVATPDLLGAFYLIFQHTPHAWGEDEAYAKRNAVVERMRPELRERLRSGAQLQLDTRILFAGRRTILACMAVTSLLVFLLGARLVHALACGAKMNALVVFAVAGAARPVASGPPRPPARPWPRRPSRASSRSIPRSPAFPPAGSRRP